MNGIKYPKQKTMIEICVNDRIGKRIKVKCLLDLISSQAPFIYFKLSTIPGIFSSNFDINDHIFNFVL